MKTVALIWELGSGLGHLSTFLPVVKGIKAKGMRPVLIVSDVSKVPLIYKDEELEFFQAPTWLAKLRGDATQDSVVDTLFHIGFLSQQGLGAMVDAWVNLFKVIDPDVLILDYAPTALLANKVTKIPSIIFGNSFSIPPKISPITPYEYWNDNESKQQKQLDKEKQCVTIINSILRERFVSGIKFLHDIYSADHCFVTTDRLLDVYQEREEVEYIGAISTEEIGRKDIIWPLQHKPKVFVYLKQDYKHLSEFLKNCSEMDAQFCIFIQGLHREIKDNYSLCKNITFSDQPYQIKSMSEQCDYAVIHGGNLLDKFMEAGTPLLLLPTQKENLMMAHKAKDLGSAIYFHPAESVTHLKVGLYKLLSMKTLKENAVKCSEGFMRLSQGEQVDRVINRVALLIDKAN